MTILKTAALSSAILLAGLGGCSSGNHHHSDPMTSADYKSSSNSYMASTSAGSVMTTPDGMTVYTFDKDQAGKSNCYGECAMHWPPVTAATNAHGFGRMTLVSRTDGLRQWAYDDKPLYTYHDDSRRGDVEGNNAGGVWHVVK